jgi:hypothetical protein
VITDGGDNASQATLVQTKVALLHSGVRLFAFLFDVPLPAPDDDPIMVPYEQDGRNSFRKMVDDSGGCLFSIAGLRRRYQTDFEYTYDKENQRTKRSYSCTRKSLTISDEPGMAGQPGDQIGNSIGTAHGGAPDAFSFR